MSNALAIANVTETLAQLLTAALPASGLTGASVTTTRPDLTAQLPGVGVNVFLYQVRPNPSWRNADLPTRTADGTLLRRPQAALDLFYLISCYGNDLALEPQRLLGTVVRQLHAYPVLSRTAVDTAASVEVNGVSILAGSNLADQVELVRFVPVNYSLEEFSKLWSVFLKTDYVLSVAYSASVVLIETDDLPPAAALPVLRARVKAVPFSLACIASIEPQSLPIAPAPALTQITLIGQNLALAETVSFLTPGESTPIPGTIISSNSGESQMVVQLPAGLRPGINGVSLTGVTALPVPPGTVLAQSNTAAFVVQPSVSDLAIPSAGLITAAISPAVGPLQTVTLILNQTGVISPAVPLAFELTGVPDATQPGVFDFATSYLPLGSTATVTVPTGTYLVRAQVDSAQSALTVNASGAFSGPTISLP